MKISFQINSDTVADDRERMRFAAASTGATRWIGRGTISIKFRPQSEAALTIETEVVDYLDQLSGVFEQLNDGPGESFVVSGDYCSNHLRFVHDDDGDLRIIDGNSGELQFRGKFNATRNGFRESYSKAIAKLNSLYPEIKAMP